MTGDEVQRVQNAAHLMARAAEAMIRAMGMVAENQMREHRGESPAYVEEAFTQVILDCQIGVNDAVTLLRQGC